MNTFFTILFNGISLSSILLLAALGLSITFGLMRVINMAHGEFIMIGAYSTFLVQNFFIRFLPASAFDLYYPVAILVSFFVSAGFGAALEQLVIKRLYGRETDSLLATWGVSLVLQQLARSVFGAPNVNVSAPSILNGNFEVAGVIMTYKRLFIIVLVAFCLLLMYLLMYKTSYGKKVRATMQNRSMAQCLGIHTNRIDTLTFAIGSGLAGVAGAALCLLGPVGSSLGQNYIVDTFMVVVLGGVGKLAGSIAGALLIGMSNAAIQFGTSANIAKAIVLFLVIMFLQKRPQGLFTIRSRSLDESESTPTIEGLTFRQKNLAFAAIMMIVALLPLFLSPFRVSLVGKYITYAIVALSLDLIWGHTGILSLGHGVFFGLGGYGFGMYLKLVASGSSLPDFMSWSGRTSLPWFWDFYKTPSTTIFMVIMVPALLAFLLGLLTFTNRIKGVYFSILSQALALVFVTLFVGLQEYTGGTNGITDFSTLFGLPIAGKTTKYIWYYVALAILILTYALFSWVMRTRCGKVLVAIRDGENRTRFSGYQVANYKTFVYSLSAVFTGIAGALFVPFSGIISPSEMSISNSIDMAIWVAVGGRGNLIGAVLGAFLVNITKTLISENFPEIWSYFIGAIFVLVVLFLPRGVMGICVDVKNLIKGKLGQRRQKNERN
ncbi:urea ABC transporter permease subunit UrtC [Treponema ruminis]|uniref:Urea ABC transporter permease protein UrtC/urea ABC transporter permease protein UrtB n=1 Tax=Treponema ruminis TaxID=744515 RepID=A0A7W8GB16_9SPIR|nr:urea ABC transporter permease subunit UrtC [Treponema ruminis]MBB5227143.1 urea ABC transporter permease protein UrtC/urea ABC transporter permease protein UrtB [Treponema ruminis]